ncbi:MAG TPA: ABC transporter ATP-binding protein [Hyphomicrobiaceae bacterium]|nr:ABC transporter ATP-binding protein [Hyphomicrobiaceae bacterium]
MIALEKVSAGIGRVQILREVDLAVAPGKLVLVLGANGAGKTTLLRVISGVVPLWSGKMLFHSDPIAGRPAHELARLGLVHVPQGRQIIPTLSVEENLTIGASHLPGVSKDEIARRLEQEYARFPVLKTRRGLAGGSLSGGEQQMLAVSRGLMMAPKLIMLDEPSLGLAPQMVRRILGALAGLAKSGIAVLLMEQKTMAIEIADHVHVLKNGAIVHSAAAADVRDPAELFKHYMG